MAETLPPDEHPGFPKRFVYNDTEQKTYANVENLNNALVKHGLDKMAHILCYTATGRVTAVFVDKEGFYAAQKGFKWVHGW